MSLPTDRVMIFHPNENGRFINFNSGINFTWNGEHIGEISPFISKIPAVKGNNLFYVNGINQYVILKIYNPRTHIIEMIKRVYELPMIPYNICTYKGRTYIVYSYKPFNEIEYSLWRKKKEDITDAERIIFFFHWILGVKGKIVRAYLNGTSGDSVVMSNGSYSEIDYNKNEISQAKIMKYFGDYKVFQNVGSFFYDDLKIDRIRDIVSQQNYWWFQEIESRIKSNFLKLETQGRFTLSTLYSVQSHEYSVELFNKDNYTPYIPDDVSITDNVINNSSPKACYDLFQQPYISSDK